MDITWVFLLTLYMALNTILWAISYPDVREAHPREKLEDLVNSATDIIDRCSDRWPGTEAASQLYSVFAKACLQSYDAKGDERQPHSFSSPPLQGENGLPISEQGPHGVPTFNPPQFGNVFDSTPEDMSTGFNFDLASHPSFRSNSIFHNPGTDSHGRRFSYFPPEFPQPDDTMPLAAKAQEQQAPAPALMTTPFLSKPPPAAGMPQHFADQTSPTTVTPISTSMPTNSLVASLNTSHNGLKNESPTSPHPHTPIGTHLVQPGRIKDEPGMSPHVTPTFVVHHASPHPPPTAGPRPVPSSMPDWFNAPPAFISPYAFSGGMPGAFWGDQPSPGSVTGGPAPFSGFGPTFAGNAPGQPPNGAFVRQPAGPAPTSAGPPHQQPHQQQQQPRGMNPAGFTGYPPPMPQFHHFNFAPERSGSLSVEQQVELMDVLESEGIGEIDAFLNAGMRWN
jgi:hypothetical protein